MILGGSVLEDEPRFRRFEVQNFKVHSNTKWKMELLVQFEVQFLFGGSKFGFRG